MSFLYVDIALLVNFNPVTYMVEEGENTDIMVVLNNPSSSEVTVEVVTVVGTADGKLRMKH